MNILDFAMQMELDGKAFYEAGAAKMTEPELKKILLTLAEEEDKHYRFFKKLKNLGTEPARLELTKVPTTFAANRNLFQKMADRKGKPLGADVRAVWQEALKIEEKSEQFYREESAKESDSGRRHLLELVADEEKTHIYLIDNMLSFMSDPKTFLDSTQYKSFMSWEGR